MSTIAQPVRLATPQARRPSAVGLVAATKIHWVVALLLITMVLPPESSVMLGSVRLSPYRFVLLLAIVPCFLLLLSGRAGRLVTPDFLMLGHGIWAFISLAKNHGMGEALEPGGVYIVEGYGTYLIARVFITDLRSFRAFCAGLVLVVMFITLLTIPEMLTGKHYVRELFAQLRGQGFSSGIGKRFGLHRSYGPFDHPILWGIFASTVLSMSWFALVRRDTLTFGRFWRSGWVWLGAVTSVSSGALACLMVQGAFIGYERVTRWLTNRWTLLLIGFGAVYGVVGLASNRSAMNVFLYYLTFNAHTAYNRIRIWNYGTDEVIRHPVFGIGLNDWQRPDWMHSPSFDNFWLFNAMRYGLPTFLMLAGSVALIARGAAKHGPKAPNGRPLRFATSEEGLARLGWGFSMIGLAVAAFTVHFWNSAVIFFYLIIGAGVWMMQKPKRAPRPRYATAPVPTTETALAKRDPEPDEPDGVTA